MITHITSNSHIRPPRSCDYLYLEADTEALIAAFVLPAGLGLTPGLAEPGAHAPPRPQAASLGKDAGTSQ